MSLVPSEQALASGRQRGAVDAQLLELLRDEPLVCGLEEIAGEMSFAVRDIQGGPSALAWTTEARARDAGWSGSIVQRPSREIATLLAGSGLGLAINPGSDVGVGLDPVGVAGLVGTASVGRAATGDVQPERADVPAGTTVYLGEPAVPPTAWQDELARVLPGLSQVTAARMAQVVIGSGPSHPMLVLTAVPGTSDADRGLVANRCLAAAQQSGADAVDVVFDDQLGTLRDDALAVPLLFQR